MDTTKYNYGEIKEPPKGLELEVLQRTLEREGKPRLEVLPPLYSHLFIIAWNSTGKRYAFGTTPQMLKERADAERFTTCDLSRYPVGSPTGFVNKVVVIQNEETVPLKAFAWRASVDGALHKYDSDKGFKVLRRIE